MRTIEDLQHFVLAEGETLILRCKIPPSEDQLQKMRKAIEHLLPGRPVIILPPEIEVCAGQLEVWGVEDDAHAEADMQTQEQVRRDNIMQAYTNGKTVWARDADGQVFYIQIAANPHTFDWGTYSYGLTAKDVRP